jgi:hypothetical protein
MLSSVSRSFGLHDAGLNGHSPTFPSLPYLAAALGQLGRVEEAKIALKQAIAIASNWFDMYVSDRAPWWRLEDHAQMVDGLRRAGWGET